MDDGLAGHRRYLAAMTAAASAEPGLHGNQLAALERERAVAARGGDGGDLFELSRGLWLDRLIGHARIAGAVDDPWSVAACRIELDAALAAGGSHEWGEVLSVGSVAAAPLRATAAEATAAYTRLMLSLVRIRAEARPGDIEVAVNDAAGARHQLRQIDPAALGVDPPPRARWRNPFGEAQAIVAGWMAAIAPADDDAVEVTPPPDAAVELAAMEAAVARWRAELAVRPPGTAGPAPAVDAVVAPYAALAALAGDTPELVALRTAAAAMVAAAAGAPSAQDALAIWVERGLDVALSAGPIFAGLTTARAQAAAWPVTVLGHHADTLAHELARATTPTAIDLVAMHGAACLAVEADWLRILSAGLLAPVRAAMIAELEEPADALRELGWAAFRDLAGGSDALLGSAWFAGALDLIAGHAGALSTRGTFQGEAGAEVVADARAAIGFARARGAAPALHRAGLTAFLATRWGQPPAGPPRRLTCWGRPLALDELTKAPVRPALPGR